MRAKTSLYPQLCHKQVLAAKQNLVKRIAMPIRSYFPNVYVPPQTFPDFLFERGRPFRDKPIIVDGISSQAYAVDDIDRISASIANGLRHQGVQKGTVVALVMPTCPEYTFISLGVMRAGGCVSGANPTYTAPELSHHLAESQASFVFTDTAHLSVVSDAARESGRKVRAIYLLEGEPSKASYIQTIPYTDLLFCKPLPPLTDLDPAVDLAALPFSSGTTGRSKGVMHTHQNLVAALVTFAACDPQITPGPNDRMVTVLPAFHIYGFCLQFLPFLRGFMLVHLPGFSPLKYLTAMDRYKPTVLYVVPPILVFLAKHPSVDQSDLSSIRVVMSGAAPVGGQLMDQFQNRFPKIKYIIQSWGMTEAPMACTLGAPTVKYPSHASCGTPLPNIEMKVVSLETGNEVGVREDGEIHVRGPVIMQGYLNHPEATAETLSDDGWLRTGDIGHYDENRFFYIVDRKKELIKVKGFQVAPAELEDVVLSHPKVADAAVIGVPDDFAGEVPKAFVVRKRGYDVTEKEIDDYVRGKVAPFKQLAGGVSFVDYIPKTASGKILRRKLRQYKGSNSKL